MTGDLTTLAKVKVYLGIDATDTSVDGVLTPLISSQSRLFKTKARRDIIYQKYVETRDGNGTPGIDPWHYPVQSVDSVLVDNVAVPVEPATVAGDAPQYGWVLSRDRIEIVRFPDNLAPFVPTYGGLTYGLTPYRFTRGYGNVVLTYWAGYLVKDEAATIPATPYQVQAQDNFNADVSVTLSADGTVFTKVTGTPATGQYAVSATGQYTFAAADTGKAVLLTYGIVPTDVEQAVNEMVEWAFRRRDRAGQRSKIVGSENVSFQTDPIPPSAQGVIDFYQRTQV